MIAKEIAIRMLASETCRTLLARLEGLPSGRKVLNKVSHHRGVYDSFEQAWAAARRSTYAGHDHPDYIQSHLELSKALRPSDYAALFWLLRERSTDLRVFDFGGGVGNLYYTYSTHLRMDCHILDWTVFDLPNTVEEGRRVASERGITGLQFTNSLESVSENHVLLISGAFHYWEKSVQEFLEQFPHRPARIIVNRTPVHDTQPSFITVQYKKAYAVPCIVRNAVELISAFTAMGYKMVDRWPALELALRMPLFPDRTVPSYSGFCFRRAEAKADASSNAYQPAA
jgi:putative methyltransferase (TIGR04325 family)